MPSEGISSGALIFARVAHIAKMVPRRALSDWLKAFINEGNALTFAVAVLISWIALQNAGQSEKIAEAEGWLNAAIAVAYVSCAWLVFCVLRAPYMIWRDEQRAGFWTENRFNFHAPLLIATIRARATGEVQSYPIPTQFMPSNAFLYYRIDIDRPDLPKGKFTACLVSTFVLGSEMAPGMGVVNGGVRLGKNGSLNLYVTMAPDLVSRTFSVYALNFAIGNPSDRDGKSGTSVRSV